MVLNLQTIINAPGERLPFRFSMDLRDMELGGAYPIQEPVAVEGEVRNSAGLLTLEFEAHTVLKSVCDRCAKPFDNPKTVRFTSLLADELEGEESDEIILLEDHKLDVGELARSVFLLEMDTKTLCRPDCRGLCPGCGVDLNEGSCTCQKAADPRWEALRVLLERESKDE